MSKQTTTALVVLGLVGVALALGGATVSAAEETMTGVTVAVRAFAQAIAKAEGFFVAGSVPARCNNPGDLTAGDVGDSPSYPKSGPENIIIFPTVDLGWSALYQKLARIRDGMSAVYTPDMTLAQMGLTYSGGDPNWAMNVASALNTTTDATLGSLLNGL